LNIFSKFFDVSLFVKLKLTFWQKEGGSGQQLLNGMTVQKFTVTSGAWTERSSPVKMFQD